MDPVSIDTRWERWKDGQHDINSQMPIRIDVDENDVTSVYTNLVRKSAPVSIAKSVDLSPEMGAWDISPTIVGINIENGSERQNTIE